VIRSGAQELAASVKYLRESGKASAHAVIGPTSSVDVVPDELEAWHARDPLNQTHKGYEVTQNLPGTPYTPFQYADLAQRLVADAKKYGFPLQRVWSQAVKGIIGHEDTENGKQDGKSDPGPLFDWTRLQREIEALVAPAFDVEAERAAVWKIKDRLAANGWPRFAQALEAATTQSKGEK
jgi:N-acetyl-anhydromuramyl-L-alanine amidase AmpD